MRRIAVFLSAVALLAPVLAGCGAGSAQGSSGEASALIPEPTQTPWIVERTVVVTRIVEVVVKPTEAPATPEPTPTPIADLPGTRDLSIVPRPPDASISRYATTRKHLFLDYSFSSGGLSAAGLAEYFTAAMDNYGWDLTRLESEDERFSLTFEPRRDAPEPMQNVDYARIIIRGDISQMSIVVNTLRDVADWEPFLSS
jgi:hypothetical protein